MTALGAKRPDLEIGATGPRARSNQEL